MPEVTLSETVDLLLQRDRELGDLRRRFSRALGWLPAVERMSALAREGGPRLAAEWPRIAVTHLGLQSVALWFVRPGGDGLDLVACAGGTRPAPEIRKVPWLAPLLATRPDGIDNGTEPAPPPLGQHLGLRRYLWSTLLPDRDVRYLATLGYNAATWNCHPPFDDEDLRFSRMMATMLEAMLGQLHAVSELTSEREQLGTLNDHLTRSEREVRRMQEEMLESTRLAAVGELAGLTAHEVLNPITAIQGRVTRMLDAQDATFAHNQRSLRAVHDAWAAAIGRGGPEALFAELRTETSLGTAAAEEDVAVLRDVAAHFARMLAGYQDDLGFLLREIQRITYIVDGLRGLHHRRSSTAPEPLRALLAESVDALRDGIERRGIAIELVCEGEPRVQVDRYECIQVVTNVLRNGVLAIAERGRAKGTVTVRVEHGEGRAHVLVEDDGIGIRPEHEARLFEMRFSTRADGAGTGLGLCIARRLLRGWQGELSLAWTRPGEGTCFLIELPLAEAPEE